MEYIQVMINFKKTSLYKLLSSMFLKDYCYHH